MTKTFQTFIQYLRGSSRLEFWILVIRICFGFRVSCFEFIENRISKQFSLSQQVISLNDVALSKVYSFENNFNFERILYIFYFFCYKSATFGRVRRCKDELVHQQMTKFKRADCGLLQYKQ